MNVQPVCGNDPALPLGTLERLAAHAASTGTAAPARILDEEGSFTDELLTYCDQTDLSLDWLWFGDRSKIRALYFGFLEIASMYTPGGTDEEEAKNARLDALLDEQIGMILKEPVRTIEDLAIVVHVSTFGGSAGLKPAASDIIARILGGAGLPVAFGTCQATKLGQPIRDAGA